MALPSLIAPLNIPPDYADIVLEISSPNFRHIRIIAVVDASTDNHLTSGVQDSNL